MCADFMFAKLAKSLLSRFIFITLQLILFNVADAYRMQQFDYTAMSEEKKAAPRNADTHFCQRIHNGIKWKQR